MKYEVQSNLDLSSFYCLKTLIPPTSKVVPAELKTKVSKRRLFFIIIDFDGSSR